MIRRARSASDEEEILALKCFLLFRIFTFFEKIEIWLKVSSVPNVMHQKIENLKISFSVSKLIYENFSLNFSKLFNCSDSGEEPRVTKSSRKKLK